MRPSFPKRRLFALGAVLVLLGLWGLDVFRAAGQTEASAASTQAALATAKSRLSAGDFLGARASVESARTSVTRAHASAGTWAVRWAAHIPVLSVAVADLDHLIAAASDAVTAMGDLVNFYSDVSGASGKPKIFAHGQLDLTRLEGLSTQVDQSLVPLYAAQSELRAVKANLPGTGFMARARDKGLVTITPIILGLEHAKSILPLLPDAFGANRVHRYLIAILNQAEIRASGGAPLSLVLLSCDQGTIKVLAKGQTSTQFFPGLPPLTWKSIPGNPFDSPTGVTTARFTAADFHPDFRTTGPDLVRAWAAGGYPPVDGVIGIDITALAAVLTATGPLQSQAYGTVTGTNLGQKLLFGSYARFGADQAVRQALNQDLEQALIQRLSGGGSITILFNALTSTAPGRHFQIYVGDPDLERELAMLHLDGSLGSAPGDRVAVFSSNNNGSKLDVYQQRSIAVTARIAADGSAQLTQRITVKNATPPGVAESSDNFGYFTNIANSSYYLYAQPDSTNRVVMLPQGWSNVGSKGGFLGRTWVDDGYGRLISWWQGSLAAGASATMQFSYHLPAGTFGGDGTPLVYRLHVDPQSLWQPEALRVTVIGPGGTAPSLGSFVVDRQLDLSVSVPLTR